MKAFFAAIKRSPKLAVMVTALVGAVVVPAALLAWGPSNRPTFTMANPASYVTFNSITDNPDQGDERNFVRIREAGVGTYKDDIQIQPGKEYEVSVFYHNNAATYLNSAEENYKGIAVNAKARVEMPATAKAGQKVHMTGYVSADNAQPQQVWDEAYVTPNVDVALRYVANSAKFYTKGAINGQAVANTLYTTGAPLGFNAQDGKVPGCNEYEGWIVYRIKAVAPDFDVEKTVSKVGSNKFSEKVSVKPGDKVEYKIQYKNTGSVDQKDVVIKDQLPAGVSYIPGSTYFANAATGGQWKKTASNDIVTSTGINLGTYTPGSNVYVSFKAKVVDANKLKCGINTLVNTASAETDNGGKSDTATVVVKRVCENVPPKEEVPPATNVPHELPQTGISGGALAIFGLSSLTAGFGYALRSDRIRSLLRG
jgi:uncharacterized repeat protein (TIGR01451 family)/LPXTG-motif cell wall-anchored protein